MTWDYKIKRETESNNKTFVYLIKDAHMNFKFNLISFIFVLIIFLKFDHDDITAAEDLCDCY